MSVQSKINTKSRKKEEEEEENPKYLFPGLQKLTVRNKMFSEISTKVYLGKGLGNAIRDLSPQCF